MNDPNRLMKWLLIIGLVVLSLVILYPPGEKLKGGIDLVGGTSMLFEIDTTGLEPNQMRDLSTKVMEVLKDRVDPNGQRNLEWRPVGNTRLEIRMPRPPKKAIERRDHYNKAIELLAEMHLSRFEVESALNASQDSREAALAKLVKGIDERVPLIEKLQEAYSTFSAMNREEDLAATESAKAAYEEAMSALLATSMPVNRLTDVLSLKIGPSRDKELEKLREEYPSYDAPGSKRLTTVVQAYALWAKDKADLEDPSDLKRLLRGAGVLEFRILADRDPASPGNTTEPSQPISRFTTQLSKYGPRPQAGDRFIWLPIDDILRFTRADNIEDFESRKDLPGQPIIEEYAGRYYVLFHNDANMSMLQAKGTGKRWKLQHAFPDRDPMTGENVVSFGLDPQGGQQFGELTGSNKGRQLCIVLDDTAMSRATIRERITTRCQISGGFTQERAQDLVRILDAGSLPARLRETPLQEQTVGPTLGESNRVKGLRAAAIGGISVAVFILAYYGFVAGGMANVALAMNLLMVLAVMALVQATFTLPGIAGLLLTVGMAVDANVLIFERFREERDRGVIFKKALNAGYDKAFSTIIDANVTTLLTCVILGFVGSEEVKGFAIVLGIGIVTSMFTSLFVTRLVFNTLIAKGMLKDLSMRRLIGQLSIDWLGMYRMFVPISIVAVGLGLTIFFGLSAVNKEAVYDIEFLGGTSIQIDFKDGIAMKDQEVTDAITSTDPTSAAGWLRTAADALDSATASPGEQPGQFTLTSAKLTGAQLGALMREAMGSDMDRDGIQVAGHTATFITKSGQMVMEQFEKAKVHAAEAARRAADRLGSARVQSVTDLEGEGVKGASYELSTIETNRGLVQAAVLAVLGDKLAIQRAINFTTVEDEELTRAPFFVVESDDHFLSDVIGGDSTFDVRRFRGGSAIQVVIGESEEAITSQELERRLREVSLQPEFDQLRTLDSVVFPLGSSTTIADGQNVYRAFAVLAVDEALMYDADPVQWEQSLAQIKLAQVRAALGSEKSFSKVIAFAPQIAKQTKNRAIFAAVLAFCTIVAYLWLRFGSKDYGLAAIVCLVHDISITLGLVAVSHYVFNTFIGKALLISDFKIDLPMIAALLTVVGYSLNDTIVVFDRIRENKGKVGKLNRSLINNSINQTLARTLLTSITTALVVFILYVFGGQGVHGFSFAMLIGVIVGTYSSVAVAAPLLHRPVLLRRVVMIIAGLGVVGIIFAEVPNTTAQIICSGITGAIVLYLLTRGGQDQSFRSSTAAGASA